MYNNLEYNAIVTYPLLDLKAMLSTYPSTDNKLAKKYKQSTNSNLTVLPEEVINSEQFSKIIDAILNGKYSWACVLFLYWSNYNPLHYIPYRTFNRLIKENLQSHNIAAK